MQRDRILNTLALGATLALSTGSAFAQGAPEYHVTRMGDMIEELFPGVTYPSSRARALNENGDLVGEATISDNGHQRGWIYTVEHGVVPLPVLPGDTRGMAWDVSDRDANGDVMIIGSSAFVVQPEMAVLWRFSTVTGEVLETRSIGIPPGFDDSIAVAVNNDGTVVGFSSYIGPFTSWKYDVATDVLETFDFPARVADLNNVGQVCGGTYRGDINGNYEDLADLPDSRAGILHKINDLGWVVGRAGTGQSDGAGHYLVAIVRFADPVGWTDMEWISHLSLAGGINDQGDFMSRSRVYLDDQAQEYSINALLAPEFPNVFTNWAAEINNNRQIATWSGDAILLTPLGVMIIPGDVNGDVQVDLDDHCAWVADPIDLDDDGVVNAADEQWLFDRLAVFGFTVEDCNGNGLGDRCDILDGFSQDCDLNVVPDECQADCNGDGVPDVCEPDCNGNGNPDPCDIQQGTSDDCNGNGIPDECDGGGVTEVMHVFDPPVELYADTTFVFDINVIDAGTIDDVDFTFDIHYRIGDLSVMLSHNGTTITLLDRPGHPESFLGNGQLGYDIILDDEGTGGAIENQGNFGSPFTQITSPPSYTPDEPLSTFDGMPMQGIWTVHVVIRDFHPAHTFDDWGLTLTRAGAPVGPCACPADLDANGMIGFSDLSAVLSKWGACTGCPEDFDENGDVGFTDLVYVLGEWGPC